MAARAAGGPAFDSIPGGLHDDVLPSAGESRGRGLGRRAASGRLRAAAPLSPADVPLTVGAAGHAVEGPQKGRSSRSGSRSKKRVLRRRRRKAKKADHTLPGSRSPPEGRTEAATNSDDSLPGSDNGEDARGRPPPGTPKHSMDVMEAGLRVERLGFTGKRTHKRLARSALPELAAVNRGQSAPLDGGLGVTKLRFVRGKDGKMKAKPVRVPAATATVRAAAAVAQASRLQREYLHEAVSYHVRQGNMRDPALGSSPRRTPRFRSPVSHDSSEDRVGDSGELGTAPLPRTPSARSMRSSSTTLSEATGPGRLRDVFRALWMRLPHELFYVERSLQPASIVDLENWRHLVTDGALGVLAACPASTAAIEDLSLARCARATDVGFCVLLPRLHRLRRLDLSYTSVSQTTADAMVQPTRARVCDGGLLDEDADRIEAILRADVHARVDGHDRERRRREAIGGIGAVVQAAGAVYVPPKTPSLRLGLNAAAPRLPAGVDLAEPACSSLRSIVLRHCDFLTDKMLRLLCRHLPRLEELDVSWSKQVSDAGLRAVAHRCSRTLRRLATSGCAITDATLQEIARLSGAAPNSSHLRSTHKDSAKGGRSLLSLESLVLSDVKRISTKGLNLILRSCGSLSSLDVSGCRRAVTDELLEGVFRSSAQLFRKAPLHFGSELSTVSLARCDKVTAVGVGWMASRCIGATSIDLSECPAIDDRGLLALNMHSRLTDLNLSGCISLSSSGLRWMIVAPDPDSLSPNPMPSRCRGIRSLDLSRAYGLGDDQSCRAIAQLGGCLEELDMSELSAVTTAGVKTIVEHCHNIRKLLLRHCTAVSESAVKRLARLRNLQVIDITGCRGVTDASLRALSNNRALRVVRAGGPETGTARSAGRVGFVTDEGVVALASTWASLRQLELTNHPRLTTAGIEHLESLCVDLRQLNIAGCDATVTADQITRLARARAKWHVNAVLPGDEEGFIGFKQDEWSECKILSDKYSVLSDAEARAATVLWKGFHRWQYRKRRREARETQKQREAWAARLVQRHVRGWLGRNAVRDIRNEKLSLAKMLDDKRARHAMEAKRRRAAAFFDSNFKRKAFHWFIAAVRAFQAEFGTLAERRRRAAQFAFSSLKHRAFMALAAAVIEQRDRKARAIRQWQGATLRRMMYAWREKTEARVLRRRRLAQVFITVTDPVRDNSDRMAPFAQRASQHLRGVLLRKCFQPWSVYPRIAKIQEQKHIVGIFMPNMGRRVLLEWHKHTQYKKRVRRVTHNFLLGAPARQKQWIWRVWRQYTAESKLRKEQLRRQMTMATQHHFLSATQIYFNAWRQAAKIWKKKRIKMMYADYYAKRMYAKLYLHAWVSVIKYRINYRNIATAAEERWRKKHLKWALDGWWNGMGENIKKQAKIRRAVMRWKKRELAMWFTAFQQYAEYCKEVRLAATAIQALFRKSRAIKLFDFIKNRTDLAARVIQRVFRGFKGRKIYKHKKWHRRLVEYRIREREEDTMKIWDQYAHEMRTYINAVIFVQQAWQRRKCVWKIVQQMRQRRREKRIEDREKQEQTRQAYIEKLKEREVLEAQREEMATIIQQQVKVFLAKCHKYHLLTRKREDAAATKFQTAFRGLRGRQMAAARRRVRETKARVLRRRRRTGFLLRMFGFRNRKRQQNATEALERFGLDPESFTLFLGAWDELKRDANEIVELICHVRKVFVASGTNLKKRTRLHDAYVQRKRLEALPVKGDAIRIVLPSHPRVGETALVMNADLSFGRHRTALKLDKDGQIEHLPILTAAEANAPSMFTMIRIPDRRLKVLPPNPDDGWREEVIEWARREKLKRIRIRAATLIQQKIRGRLGPLRAAKKKEKAKRRIARNRKFWLIVLKALRINNKSVGDWLVGHHLARRIDIPPELLDRPVNQVWERYKARTFRAKMRRPHVQLEVDRRRAWISRQRRVEWSKMTRWERRQNWSMAPVMRAHRTPVQKAVDWLIRQFEDTRAYWMMRNSMLYDDEAEFRSRAHRTALAVVSGAKHLRMQRATDTSAPRSAWLGAYTFPQLLPSQHTQAPPPELQAEGTRFDKPVNIDGTAVLSAKQRKVLKFKSPKPVDDLGNPRLLSLEEDEAEMSAGFMKLNKTGAVRMGGGGSATVLAVWDSQKPHGTGKAKFIMDEGYDPAQDPLAWDMYDELVCQFELGEIVGEVTISYQDGSIYKGPYVEELEVLEAWEVDHVERLAAAKRREAQLAIVTDEAGEKKEGDDAGGAGEAATSKKATDPKKPADAKGGGNAEDVDEDEEAPARQPTEVEIIAAEKPKNKRKPDHFGLRKMPSGVVWDGHAVDNHFNPATVTGNCRVRYVSGEWYDGDWVNGRRHGRGVRVMADGTRFDGEWFLGQFHGNGVKVTPTGEVWEGNWRYGVQVGESKQWIPKMHGNIEFAGTVFGGMWHGHGWCSYSNGDVYEGEFGGGHMHGFGVCIYDNGEQYKGYWRLGKRHGQGKLWCEDGTTYEGPFEDDKRHGIGYVVDPRLAVNDRMSEHDSSSESEASVPETESEGEGDDSTPKSKKKLKEEAEEKAAAQADMDEKADAAAARRTSDAESTDSEEAENRRRRAAAAAEDNSSDSESSTSQKGGASARSQVSKAKSPASGSAEGKGVEDTADGDATAEGAGDGAAADTARSTVRFMDDDVSVASDGAPHDDLPPDSELRLEMAVPRAGRWEHGEFLFWLTPPISKRATDEFCNHFNTAYDYESVFAILAARQFPKVPVGVDARDPRVQTIVRMITPHAGELLGVDNWRELQARRKLLEEPLPALSKEVDQIWDQLDAVELKMKRQAKSVLRAKAHLVRANFKFNEKYKETVDYWQEKHPNVASHYQKVCKELIELPRSDWDDLRVNYKANPGREVRNLMDAVCVALGMTPDLETGVQLLQSSKENMLMGMEDAQFRRYDVLILDELERFDVFKLCGMDRAESLSRYVTMPTFTPENTDYFVISDAAPALCAWIRALVPMVHAARPIETTRETVAAYRQQLKLRQGMLWGEQEEYAKLERHAAELREKHSKMLARKHDLEEQLVENAREIEKARQLLQNGILAA